MTYKWQYKIIAANRLKLWQAAEAKVKYLTEACENSLAIVGGLLSAMDGESDEAQTLEDACKILEDAIYRTKEGE